MKRLNIKWDTVDTNRCEGVATVFDFYEDSCVGKFHASRFKIVIEQGCISATSASRENGLPPISKEEMEIINTMATAFFSGVRKNNGCFHWMHEGKDKHSREVVLNKV